MNPLENKRNIIINVIKWILIILIPIGIILFNKYFNLDKLIKIHVEKEKENGEKEVNQQLYIYNTQTPIDKFIVTDYQYLSVLPDIDKYFRDNDISSLKSSSQIFEDKSVGFLLWTPSYDDSRKVPDFIEAKIKSGQYTEVFNTKGYRFIKIH